MNFWDFLVAADTDSIFLVLIVLCVTVYQCVMRICRCININKSGWPPRHCDADGDHIEED